MIRRRFHALMKLGQTYYTFSGSLCIYIYTQISVRYVYIACVYTHIYLYRLSVSILFCSHHRATHIFWTELDVLALKEELSLVPANPQPFAEWSLKQPMVEPKCVRHMQKTDIYILYMLRIYIYTLWFTHEQWWFSIFFFVNVYQRGYR